MAGDTDQCVNPSLWLVLEIALRRESRSGCNKENPSCNLSSFLAHETWQTISNTTKEDSYCSESVSRLGIGAKTVMVSPIGNRNDRKKGTKMTISLRLLRFW